MSEELTKLNYINTEKNKVITERKLDKILSVFLMLKFLSVKKTIVPESLSNFADFVYFSLIIIFLFKFLTKRVYDYFKKFQ